MTSPATPVQVQLGKHKSVAALLSTLVVIALYLVTAGELHGEALHWTRVALAIGGLLGITGSVYGTKTTATLAGPPSSADLYDSDVVDTPGGSDVVAVPLSVGAVTDDLVGGPVHARPIPGSTADPLS